MRKHKNRALCLAAAALLVGSSSTRSAGPADTHTVDGTISGLNGKGLVLRLNGQTTRNIAVNPPPGAVNFVFSTGQTTGSAYAVSVQAQPVEPSQQCTVTRGQGVSGAAERAGVLPGDLLLAIDGKPAGTVEQARAAVDPARRSAALLVQRGEARMYVPRRLS
jgi:hypothetical protein